MFELKNDVCDETTKKWYAKMVDDAILKFNTFTKDFKNIYGGMIKDKNNKVVYIKEIIYNRPAVIVFWSDGTKTSSVADEKAGDKYNAEMGLVVCVLKKCIGNKAVASLLKDWYDDFDIPAAGGRVTLKDVRKMHRK